MKTQFRVVSSCSAVAAVVSLHKHPAVEAPLLQKRLAPLLLLLVLVLLDLLLQSWTRVPQDGCHTAQLCELCCGT